MRFRTVSLIFVILALAIDAFAYRTTAWIAPWDQASLTSLQLNAGKLSESNPVWYSLNADGTIAKNWNAENATWRAAMVGTEIVPTIQNVVNGRFDAAVVETLFSTPAKREAHAETIAQLVRANAFDGVDVDYERVPTRARANQTTFFETLGQKLHASGKKLSITVYAKTTDAQNWDGPGSQDWVRIGQVADSVKIMAYDYHWSTSEAGPLAPIDWLEKVAGYAVATIPASKVIMGLPWYGYDWLGTTAQAVTYSSAIQLAQAKSAAIARDGNGEATFSYSGRTVYFQDATSYARKVDAVRAKYPSIGGFAHWRVGGEDPEIWKLVDSLRGGSVGSTPALPDFEVTGPAAISTSIGGTATATFEVVAINGFSGNVAVSVQSLSSFNGTATLSASQAAPFVPLTLRVTPNVGSVRGTYAFRVLFSNGSVTKERVISVTVNGSRTRRSRRG